MKASIIITSYNYSTYIERCLRSCFSQNFPKEEYEVIVVDDASTDDTVEILNKFKFYPNFRYIVNKDNVGVAKSSNVGISACLGRYFIRVDADDYVNSDMLRFMVKYMEANINAFCVACDYILVDNFGKKLERKYAETDPVSCGILYRTDLITKYGMYNSDFRHREEEELRKRLADFYDIHYLKIPFYRYRMHDTNKTKQLSAMERYKKILENKVYKNSTISPDLSYIEIEPEPDERPIDQHVVVVIPARGGSKRLKRKNIYPIWNKPMIYWAIMAAKQSKFVHAVYVSTEDSEIKEIAEKYGAVVIERPDELSQSRVYKQSVICHAVHDISENYTKPTLVISLQANSPQVEAEHIDKGINHLIKYKKQEVISVDTNLNQNAAIRIMKYNAVFQKTLSTNLGVFVAELHDVHKQKDVEYLENNFNR
ncbi:Acylneuraminate cytidylyltransferase [Candidatus Magnetomorum sp. HK-1]|nr:Acylneuraminate cytidylyltransferase [Candidatus Magnetomorum sp. HK-1]